MGKKGGGVSDSWLDVRKRGMGVIQMRTVCNKGWGGGGGGLTNGKHAYVINGRLQRLISSESAVLDTAIIFKVKEAEVLHILFVCCF